MESNLSPLRHFRHSWSEWCYFSWPPWTWTRPDWAICWASGCDAIRWGPRSISSSLSMPVDISKWLNRTGASWKCYLLCCPKLRKHYNHHTFPFPSPEMWTKPERYHSKQINLPLQLKHYHIYQHLPQLQVPTWHTTSCLNRENIELALIYKTHVIKHKHGIHQINPFIEIIRDSSSV